jgi:hypothetical protein
MGKKPKNASQMIMMRNAKKKKKSKNPFVRYPTEEQVEKLTGIRMHIK